MLHALRAIVPSCRSKFCSSELGSPCPAPLNSLRLSSTGQQKQWKLIIYISTHSENYENSERYENNKTLFCSGWDYRLWCCVCILFRSPQNRMRLNNKNKPVCFILYLVFTVFADLCCWAAGCSKVSGQGLSSLFEQNLKRQIRMRLVEQAT